MEWLYITMLLGCWILPSITIGVWAEKNGKSFFSGFLLSFFVSPLIGAILVASSSNKHPVLIHHERITN